MLGGPVGLQHQGELPRAAGSGWSAGGHHRHLLPGAMTVRAIPRPCHLGLQGPWLVEAQWQPGPRPCCPEAPATWTFSH